MSQNQRMKLLETVKLTLEKRALLMSRDTVEQFSPVFQSAKDKLKVSSMMKANSQYQLCLHVFTESVKAIDELKLLQLFQNEMEYLTPILSYIKDDDKSLATREDALSALSAFRKFTNVTWQQNIIQ